MGAPEGLSIRSSVRPYPRTSRKYCSSSCKTASATRSCTVTRSAPGTSTKPESTITAPLRNRWQIASTGYAEPSPKQKVKIPHAWWAICHRLRSGAVMVLSGFVEVSGADRVTVQERVADAVLQELEQYLREVRG